MYVIVCYDVQVERIDKVRNTLKRFLWHVQNSVFEGEITEGALLRLKKELGDIVDPSTDSVIFYKLRSKKDVERELIGNRGEFDNVVI